MVIFENATDDVNYDSAACGECGEVELGISGVGVSDSVPIPTIAPVDDEVIFDAVDMMWQATVMEMVVSPVIMPMI